MEIDLDVNFLTCGIEDVFLKCTNLSQLVLMNNQINVSIPECLAELPLTVLDLDSNNFSGTIPVSLWNSMTLMEFSAANNFLKGTLSVEIGKAVQLERLVLSNNQLRGTIPKDIGNLTAISVLNLNSNLLEGTIPEDLGHSAALTTLDLGNNQLSGSIPEKLPDLVQLDCLVLSHNKLSGPIPSEPSLYFLTIYCSHFVHLRSNIINYIVLIFSSSWGTRRKSRKDLKINSDNGQFSMNIFKSDTKCLFFPDQVHT
ncbi:hypothetical protein SADUNF_Sadunf16G0203400 [Salix dunnii]|uniref:Uncharacterized protein n=1 Tax=Salix dunnii TaxID=1413687 RepID=A0A835MH16_9ROSI|nr:hypothetical protein SADUNF_Sadunf16G0203400 [Salix dunnii]